MFAKILNKNLIKNNNKFKMNMKTKKMNHSSTKWLTI